MTPFVLSREALAPRIANVDPELKKTLDHLRGLGIHPRSEDDQARIERSRERLRNHLPAVAPAFVGEPGIGLTIERDSFVCGLLDPAPPWGTAEEHRRPLLDDVCSSYVPPRFDAVLRLLGP